MRQDGLQARGCSLDQYYTLSKRRLESFSMPVTVGIRLGACSARYKIEQLETMLQQKTAQLQKLERINRVLSKREQVGVQL